MASKYKIKGSKPSTSKGKPNYEEEEPEADDTDFGTSSESEDEADSDAEGKDDGDSSSEEDLESFKKALASLPETDPELYEHLKENDRDLLEVEDEEGEEDGERETDVTNKKKVTLQVIKQWQANLTSKNQTKKIKTANHIIKAFHDVVLQAQGEDISSEAYAYRMDGPKELNALMRLCLQHMVPFLENKTPKEKVYVLRYLTDVFKLLKLVSDESIVAALLRHVLQLVPVILTQPKACKLLLKSMVRFWSTGSERVRILAFCSLARVIRTDKKQFLEPELKAMYMAYVANSKFTSPKNWPLINFMKRSLVELFGFDLDVTYLYAFTFIRQLAKELHEVIVTKKKDAHKAIYNWQFIHSLHLWSHLLSTHQSPVLQPLVYPLVQITIETCKLIKGNKHIPLRFQCCRALNNLVRQTGVFIPVLPLILETLDNLQFKKQKPKQQKVKKGFVHKKTDFNCVLKLSKSELEDGSFAEASVEFVYELSVDYLESLSHTIGYPELVLPAIIRLKRFLTQNKKSSSPGCQKMKDLLAKIEENSKWVEERRKTHQVKSIADTEEVKNWENAAKTDGTPLSRHYISYRKLRDQELSQGPDSTGKDELKIPELTKRKDMKLMQEADKRKMPDLFLGEDTDESDDSEDDRIRFMPPKKRMKATEAKFENYDEEYDDGGEERYQSEDDDSDLEEEEIVEEKPKPKVELKKQSKKKKAAKKTEEEERDIVEDFKFSDDEDNE